MVGVFCGVELVGDWLRRLESGSGDNEKYDYSRKLSADDNIGNGRHFLAVVYLADVGSSSIAMDSWDNGISTNESFGTRVGDEWGADTGALDFFGNIFDEDKAEKRGGVRFTRKGYPGEPRRNTSSQ